MGVSQEVKKLKKAAKQKAAAEARTAKVRAWRQEPSPQAGNIYIYVCMYINF